jgi:hypothetical protein
VYTKRRAWPLAAAVLALLAWAPAAAATSTATNADGTAVVVTGSGGDDAIVVTVFPGGAQGPDAVHVEDPGGVTAGTGCIQDGPTFADCPAAAAVRVQGGAGNDEIAFSFQPLTDAIGSLTLLGDDGNDRITGSEQAETVSGGPGDDEIDGRGGPDQIDCGDGTDTVAPDATDTAQLNCEGGPPGGPAVLGSATQSGGALSVSWSLPAGTESWALEVARSPDGFLDPVTVVELARDQTSATTEPLPPGTYYVHVVSTPSYDICVNSPAHFLCSFDVSEALRVVVPAVGAAAAPASPSPSVAPKFTVGPDTVLALGAVKAASVQDVDKLRVTVNAGETVKVKLSGSVNVPGAAKVYRFKTVSKSVEAGETRLAPKLARKAKRNVKRALRRKRRLRARLTLVVTDMAGNSQTKRYAVRLRP